MWLWRASPQHKSDGGNFVRTRWGGRREREDRAGNLGVYVLKLGKPLFAGVLCRSWMFFSWSALELPADWVICIVTEPWYTTDLMQISIAIYVLLVWNEFNLGEWLDRDKSLSLRLTPMLSTPYTDVVNMSVALSVYMFCLSWPVVRHLFRPHWCRIRNDDDFH